MNKKKKEEKLRLYEKFKREKNPELYRKKEQHERRSHFIKSGKLLCSLMMTLIMAVLLCLAAIGAVALADERIRQMLMALF